MRVKNYDIFISHSRKIGANQVAHLIYDRLKFDFSVYLDLNVTEAGKFDELLEEHIKNCQDFILIVTEDLFKKNTSSWVLKELVWADKYKKNIIPIFLDGHQCDFTKVPSELCLIEKTNWIEYHEKQFDDVIKSIIKMLQSNGSITKNKGGLLNFFVMCIIELALFIVHYKQYIYFLSFTYFFLCIFTWRSFQQLIIVCYKKLDKRLNKNYLLEKSRNRFYYNYQFVYDEKFFIKLLNFIFIYSMYLSLLILVYHRGDFIRENNNEKWLPNIMFFILLCFIYIIENILYAKAVLVLYKRMWKYDRRHIIITGTGELGLMKDSEEFKYWILKMCYEDSLFYLQRNTEIANIVSDIINFETKDVKKMDTKDYVLYLSKNEIKKVIEDSRTRIYHINFWGKEEGNDETSKNSKCYMVKYSNEEQVIFSDENNYLEDSDGDINIKKMSDIKNITNIMEIEVFKEHNIIVNLPFYRLSNWQLPWKRPR